MKLELGDIKPKVRAALHVVQRYMVLIFILAFVGVYGFLVFRINSLTSSEPSDDAVAERLKTVQRPRIDQNAVDKIEQLKAQNIEVQTLFNEARNNPFNE